MRLPVLEDKSMETTMKDSNRNAGGQAARWNGRAGQAWVEAQTTLDRMFQPLEERLVDAALAQPDARVLDVGCGTGATTLAMARRLGAAGRCVGVDVSEPMIAAARARAEREGSPARFILADAQVHAFAPASFDLVVSRFGMMFFDDPVEAFVNLRRAARTGARLRLLAWRSAAENPFMTAAERAAAPLLPATPVRQPDAPGQFAFADRRRVARILEESGWAEIAIEPIDFACALPEAELLPYLTRLGPLGQVLPEADEATRARVVEALRAAFAPYVEGAEARFVAACWMVAARAP
jgi:SAM-dependent methyltransferase